MKVQRNGVWVDLATSNAKQEADARLKQQRRERDATALREEYADAIKRGDWRWAELQRALAASVGIEL